MDPSTATDLSALRISRAAFLVVLESPSAGDVGRMIPIVAGVTIGRTTQSDIRLGDPSLSRCHVRFTRDHDVVTLHDLGSRNGTHVNDTAVSQVELRAGDLVRAGATLMQFQNGATGHSDAWIRRTLGSSGVALWEYFAETGELVFSEHVDHALGFPPSTLARQRLALARCVHPDDVARATQALRETDRDASLELELRLQLSAALERWVVLRGHPSPARPDGPSAAGTIVDITRLKRRESTLARTAMVFESLADAVLLTDPSDEVVDVNAAAARVFSTDKARAIRSKLLAVVPIHDGVRHLSEARAAIASTGRWGSPAPVRMGELYFEVQAFPLRTECDEIVGTVWVLRDVTEKKRMADQIVFLDRLAALGTLSAGVAHEINNPLTFILGNADFVRSRPGLDKSGGVGEALDEICEGVGRIAAIVSDLKKFARAESGPAVQVTEPRAAIELALKMTGSLIRPLARVVTSYEATARVMAVESQLIQSLVNVLMNAGQAMASAHGRTADRTESIISVATRNDRDGVLIEIADTGPGMAPEVAARVFEPFFTTKPMNEGTGLGLAICHGLVTGMGGTITLDSAVGRGTTVRIWLRATADAPVATAPLPATREPHERLRVLLVDDEPLVRRAMSRMLSSHELSVADGFRAAVEHLFVRRESFDVVVCDLMMPDGTGMDLHERIAAERPDLSDRFVFVTGGAFTERAENFLQATASPTLHKPVRSQTLHHTLRQLMTAVAAQPTST
jgi:PAS domain S-box-containing protein